VLEDHQTLADRLAVAAAHRRRQPPGSAQGHPRGVQLAKQPRAKLVRLDLCRLVQLEGQRQRPPVAAILTGDLGVDDLSRPLHQRPQLRGPNHRLLVLQFGVLACPVGLLDLLACLRRHLQRLGEPGQLAVAVIDQAVGVGGQPTQQLGGHGVLLRRRGHRRPSWLVRHWRQPSRSRHRQVRALAGDTRGWVGCRLRLPSRPQARSDAPQSAAAA
jgi:hypothetical protein